MINVWIAIVLGACVETAVAVIQKGTIVPGEAEKFHNDYRNKHSLTSQKKEVKPNTLKWDPAIAVVAQKWADHLAELDAGCPAMTPKDHSPDTHRNGLGENMACAYSTDLKNAADFTSASITSSIKTAIDAWYNEYHCYQYDNPLVPKTEGAATGHFTAMMWNAATTFGMGIARSSTGTGSHYTVANYGPKTAKVNTYSTKDAPEYKANLLHPKTPLKAEECPEPAQITEKTRMETASDGKYTVTTYTIVEKKKDKSVQVTKVSKTWQNEAAYEKNDAPLSTAPEQKGGKELIPADNEEGATTTTRQLSESLPGGKLLVKTFTIVEKKNKPKEVTLVEQTWASEAVFTKGGGTPESTKPPVKGGEELLPQVECDGPQTIQTSTSTSNDGSTVTETKVCKHKDGKTTTTITVTKKDKKGNIIGKPTVTKTTSP